MDTIYSAFRGTTRVATGPADHVLAVIRGANEPEGTFVIFDHATGRQTDFPMVPVRPGPGRPKLGVVSTEITLLPRHWEWLAAQPARASGTLRRLVEEAMARESTDPQKRLEALGKILWAVAGNEPGFEEASRALYAGDRPRLEALAAQWSGDLPAVVKSWT